MIRLPGAWIISCFICFSSSVFPEQEARPCQVFFSPKDNLCKHLIQKIDNEEKGIKAAIYTFTHRQIKDALIRAKQRGADVQILVDPSCSKYAKILEDLDRENIDVFLFSTISSKKRPLMHHKFCLFDSDKSVWTGSFNFTYKADKENYENALILTDMDAYEKFVKEFESVKLDCKKFFHEKD